MFFQYFVLYSYKLYDDLIKKIKEKEMTNREKLNLIREHSRLIKKLYSKKFNLYNKNNKKQVSFFNECRTIATNKLF